MNPRSIAVVASLVAACGGSPAMGPAERGDRAALQSAIAAREKAGQMSNREAASIATAVLDRDLRSASAADAVDRVRDARPCAREVDGALAERMRTHDAAGAEAANARFDGLRLDADDARAWIADSDPSWRAVGARSLVRAQDRDARWRAIVDPSPLVRRAAARAARDTADPQDIGALAEAARVDPEPIVRTEAVRAIANMPATPAGTVANVLRDLWTSGDDGLREDIALAWSSPSVWSAGGEEALRVLVSSQHGPGVVEAAAAVLRHGAGFELTSAALAHLARAIESGSRISRLQAIAQAPSPRGWGGQNGYTRVDLESAMRKAAESDDLDVRAAALARLVETNDAKAVADILPLAQPGSPVASRARFALAGVRDRRIQAWLEQDLAAPRSDDRLAAASALALLGMAGRAAPLLADADPLVRDRAACTIVMAARVER